MAHYLSYWQPASAERALEVPVPFDHTAGEQLKRVRPGDTVWVCTLWKPDKFALLGCVHADLVTTSQREAAKRLGKKPSELWESGYHVLSLSAQPGFVRNVDITDLATKLRFRSSIGATTLRLKNGRVNALQLQTMRELEPTSAEHLARRLRVPVSAQEAAIPDSRTGAGFLLDALLRQRVERAAIKHARAYFERRSYTVVSREPDKVGYDLEVTKGKEQLLVEVKGVSGTGRDVILTRQEHEHCSTNPKFRLVVVTKALTKPTMVTFTGAQARAQYSFTPVSYSAKYRGPKRK